MGIVYYSRVYIPSKSDFGLWIGSFTICGLQTGSQEKCTDCPLLNTQILLFYYGWITRNREQIRTPTQVQQQHVTCTTATAERHINRNTCSVGTTQYVKENTIPLINFVHPPYASLTQHIHTVSIYLPLSLLLCLPTLDIDLTDQTTEKDDILIITLLI